MILGNEICGHNEKDVLVDNIANNDDITAQRMLIKAGSRVAVSRIIPCLNCKYRHNKHYNLCIHLREIVYIKIP